MYLPLATLGGVHLRDVRERLPACYTLLHREGVHDDFEFEFEFKRVVKPIFKFKFKLDFEFEFERRPQLLFIMNR